MCGERLPAAFCDQVAVKVARWPCDREQLRREVAVLSCRILREALQGEGSCTFFAIPARVVQENKFGFVKRSAN